MPRFDLRDVRLDNRGQIPVRYELGHTSDLEFSPIVHQVCRDRLEDLVEDLSVLLCREVPLVPKVLTQGIRHKAIIE